MDHGHKCNGKQVNEIGASQQTNVRRKPPKESVPLLSVVRGQILSQLINSIVFFFLINS